MSIVRCRLSVEICRSRLRKPPGRHFPRSQAPPGDALPARLRLAIAVRRVFFQQSGHCYVPQSMPVGRVPRRGRDVDPRGLWSNAIMFFNVMTAAMLASNYFETLAIGSPKMAVVHLSVGFSFDVGDLFARAARITLVDRQNFPRESPVQDAGGMGRGIFFALWVGWIMVCFTTFSLHTAPLARNSFGGDFQETPSSNMFFGLAPDKQWLGWMYTMSLDGSLARGRDGETPRPTCSIRREISSSAMPPAARLSRIAIRSASILPSR